LSRIALCSAITAPLASCSWSERAQPPVLPPPADVSRATHAPRTEHVVVVSIDGLRPDAITAMYAPTLQRLVAEGTSSLQASTILPSKTLPSHTSMVTGVLPARHGITWNTDETATLGVVRVPTMFTLAHAQGRTTAAVFAKSKFHHLEVPGSLDFVSSPAGEAESWTVDVTVPTVEGHLAQARPNLLFVHMGEPDYAGHASGWMSAPYATAIGRADSALARVIAAADGAFGAGEYTLIVTADHGGHDHGHGSASAADVTIPWLVWGEAARSATRLPVRVRTMDTAATALWLLGVAVPEDWDGMPVSEAFEETAAAN
jgi:predicted AlkP superfamily pyrophosphatase or phosphodiesterase